jgi:hypothetical protein
LSTFPDQVGGISSHGELDEWISTMTATIDFTYTFVDDGSSQYRLAPEVLHYFDAGKLVGRGITVAIVSDVLYAPVHTRFEDRLAFRGLGGYHAPGETGRGRYVVSHAGGG